MPDVERPGGSGKPKIFLMDSTQFRYFLDRAYKGEDPDILMLEAYGNAVVRRVNEKGQWEDLE